MGKKLMKNVIVPMGTVLVLAVLFRPLCEVEGGIDYWKLLFLIGIPFGVQKMFFVLVPKGYGIGEMAGIVAVNVLIGGVVGALVLAWRMVVLVVTLVSMIGNTGMRLVRRTVF